MTIFSWLTTEGLHGVQYGRIFGRVGFIAGDMVNLQSRHVYHNSTKVRHVVTGVNVGDIAKVAVYNVIRPTGRSNGS
jgi:hypothetical protein